MELKWIRVEDEMPKDNGHVQKFLVCINRRTSCFQNCDIVMAYFTDRFRLHDIDNWEHFKITHWAKIEKPDDYLK